MSTVNIQEVLNKKTIVATTVGLNKPNCYKTTDLVLVEVGDLISQQFRPWYAKQAFRLGRDRFLQLASIARADATVDPRKLFSHLLKQEAGRAH